MNNEPQDDSRVALLERRVSELDNRLQSIEAWSIETYQYQYLTRPNPTLSPPAPRWQRQEAAPWTPYVQPAAPLVAPLPTYAPPPPPQQPAPTPGVAPLWQPIANLSNRLRTPPSPPGTAPAPGIPPGQPFIPASAPPGQPAFATGPQPLPVAPAQRPALQKPRWSFSDIEQLLSGRGLAWIGGLAILLGAVFFLGLAFTRGWIGPAGRVGIGLVAALALVGAGAWFFERREALFGHVLLAVGLGTTSISLIAATRLYHLFPVAFGLAGALVIAGVAAVIAIRAGSQVVAGYGLVTALAAPPLLGASPNLTTVAFLAAALIGTTAIALYRTWNWLPTLAFFLSAPQLAVWLLDSAPRAIGLVALGGFWALNTLAAGGEEFRIRRHRLSITATTLLLVTAAFLISVGFPLLDRTNAAGGRGLFLLIMACAYGAVGAYFLRAEGQDHPFGLLATGTGVAALTMAIPIQFGGPVVPIAWAAEAAALAWVYARRTHRFSGIASLVLGTLAVTHLVSFEYPLFTLTLDRARHYGPVPFIDGAGTTLAFLLLAGCVAASFVSNRAVRAGVATVGYLLVLYAMPFETREMSLLIGWAALFVLGCAIERLRPSMMVRFPRLAATTGDADLPTALYRMRIALTGWLAVLYTYSFAFPENIVLPQRPFTDRPTLATGILIAASLLAAALATNRLMRRIVVIAPFGLVALLLPYEINQAATIVGWCALALGLTLLARRDRGGMIAYFSAAAVLLYLSVAAAIADTPPSRLTVHALASVDHPLFLSGATAALGAIVVLLSCIAWQLRGRGVAAYFLTIAGIITVYLLSVGIVDEFQRHVMANATQTTLVNLQRQAQVTLSIFWALLGGTAFIVGLVRRLAALRIGGLALLGVATVKVFLFDLASLDATYRVPALIGLGVLLLASSYIYQRLRPHDDEAEPRAAL